MKTILITAFDSKCAPIGDLTAPLMLGYASRNGWDFKCVRIWETEVAANWMGAQQTIDAFQEYDRVIFLESDILITNMEYQVPDLSPGLHMSRDWGIDAEDDNHFSTCAWIAFPDSDGVFDAALKIESVWRNELFPFQAPMRHLRETFPPIKDLIHVHPRRFLNPVPGGEGVIEPWQPGDWLCHLTNRSVEDKVKLFHEMKGGIWNPCQS